MRVSQVSSSCYDASVKGGLRPALAPIPAPEGPNSCDGPTIASYRTSLNFGPRFLIYSPLPLKYTRLKRQVGFASSTQPGDGGAKGGIAPVRIRFNVVTKTYLPFSS